MSQDLVHAHTNLEHVPTKEAPLVYREEPSGKFSRINEDYIRSVKLIFQKSCFDCHSEQTRYPWYSALPGAKQLIQSDIFEAKEHLDMTGDYPFRGHGTPSEDLNAIEEVVSAGSMPPFRYWILRWDSRLSKSEKKKIQDWIKRSQEAMGAP